MPSDKSFFSEDDQTRDQRIRERAYHLWEADGRPDGSEAEYWESARELIGMEDNPQAGQLPNPMAEHRDPSAPSGIEQAAIQENYGEIPGLADQGEQRQTPMTKKGYLKDQESS